MTVPVWQCDECGGPAVWTMHLGVIYYHCESQCDAFMQTDLFTEETPKMERPHDSGVDDCMRGDDPEGLPF